MKFTEITRLIGSTLFSTLQIILVEEHWPPVNKKTAWYDIDIRVHYTFKI